MSTTTMTGAVTDPAEQLDEEFCRHGYQPDPDDGDDELSHRAEAADTAHQQTCPRAKTFWHPRWHPRWDALGDLFFLSRISPIICCVGCGEQVYP